MSSVVSARPAVFLNLSDAKRILGLAIPAQLALLTQTGVNLVDTWFIGQLGEPERTHGQAMLSFSLALLWAIGGFLSAISVGTQAMVARREGRTDPKAAGLVLANALVLAALSSFVVMLLVLPLVRSVFSLVSADPDYIRVGTAYTRWRFVGLVSMVTTAAYKAFYDGTGRTYVHFVASVAMNVCNVALCWLLIFGNLGAPRLGVEGAGVAAAVASWIGLLVMAGWSLGPRERARYRVYRRRVINWPAIRQLARLSLPSGMATTIVMTGFIMFIGMVGQFDRAEMLAGAESAYGAATTIIINVLSLTFFSCMAFGVATATLVSRSLGERRPDRAEQYAWSSVKLGCAMFAVVGLLEVLYPEVCISFFNDSARVVGVGVASMRLMGACGPLIAVAMILTQALFGAGNPRFVMFVELGLHFFVLLPLAYLLGVVLNGRLLGVWTSAAVYIVLLAAIMIVKFRSGTWKSITL